MRFIIVGTRRIQSTRCRSMSRRVSSGSKRGVRIRWLPIVRPRNAQANGPLWYIGPGTQITESRSLPLRDRPRLVERGRAGGHDELGPSGAAPRRRRLPRARGALRERGIGHVGRRLVARRQERAAEALRLGHADDQLRIRELDDLAELVVGQAVRDRLGRRPALPRRDARDDERHRVGQRDRDEVVEADAQLLVRARQSVAVAVELLTRQRLVAARDGWTLRVLLPQLREDRAEGDLAHPCSPAGSCTK